MAGDCTSSDCPVLGGFLDYTPSKEGNAVILAAFAILLPATVGLGYRYNTLAFALLLTMGLLLQVLGFSARIILHGNVADRAYFALFLAGTTLGSTFIAAAMFSILPHTISIYGTRAWRTRPRHIAIASAGLILVIAGLEVAGAILVSFQGGASTFVLVAGLLIQILSLLLFIGAQMWMNISLSGGQSSLELKFATTYQSARFKLFLFVLQAAALILLGHTIYRAIELAGGVDGPIFQNEIAFMVANGAVPLVACILLVVFSPGAAFGKTWGPTSLRTRGKRSGRAPAPIILDRRIPRHEIDSKQMTPTPTSAGLEDSTMATTVVVDPATNNTGQPSSPGASTHKNTPGNWRELRRISIQAKIDAGLPYTGSPKASPTFSLNAQHPEPSPTYQGHQHSSRRSSKIAQTPSHLVRNDNLW